MRAILQVELVTCIAVSLLQCSNKCVPFAGCLCHNFYAHDRGYRLAITSFSRGYKAAAAFVMLPMGWLNARIASTLDLVHAYSLSTALYAIPFDNLIAFFFKPLLKQV